MNFIDLNYEELLSVDAGTENSWLKIVGEGIFTVGAVVASNGTLPIAVNIASGLYSISTELV